LVFHRFLAFSVIVKIIQVLSPESTITIQGAAEKSNRTLTKLKKCHSLAQCDLTILNGNFI
jgi:hypothetical protein